jgi:sporulation protein YlmC with PRC-barrel domain
MAHRLISSKRVEGTPVVNPRGENLGAVEEVMIEKLSGRVAFAIVSYGSFLGLDGKLFPLPWEVLTYDPDRDAYVVDLPEDRIRNAPSLDREALERMDVILGEGIRDYYGARAAAHL